MSRFPVGAYWTSAAANLRARWWEALMQALVAGLTMALVGGGLLTAVSIPASYATTAQRLNGPHLWVGVGAAQAQSVYAATSQLPQVAAVTPLYLVQAGVIRLGGKELAASISPLPASPPSVGNLTVIGGSWPSTSSEGALLERGAAVALGAGSTSHLTLVGAGGSVSVPVSGLVLDTSRASYPLSSPAAVYVSPSTWQSLGGDAGAHAGLFGVRVHDPHHLRAAAQAISGLVATGAPLSIVGGSAVVDGLQPLTLALEGFLILFGLFGLVACLSFIVGTTRADLIRQARAIGILRATGWSIGQVRWLQLGQRGSTVLAGVVAGAVAALVLAGWMTGQVVQLMGLDSALDSAPGLLVGLAVLILAATAAAVLAATRKLGRTSPAATLAAGYRHPPSPLARSVGIDRGGLAPRLGASLLLGRPGRSGTAALVLALGLVTVIFCVVTNATITNFGSDTGTWGYSYSWRVDYVKGVATADVQSALSGTPGIAASLPVYDRSAKIAGTEADARFVRSGQDLLRFHLLSGHAIGTDSEVLIGAGLASSAGLSPGQSVLLQLKSGGQSAVTVAGVYRELDNLGKLVMGRDSLLLSLQPDATPSYFLARLAPAADAAAVRNRLEQSMGGRVVVTAVRDQIAVPLGNVFEAVLLLLGFGLAAVAGVVMFTMTMILADEHSFVIGILKAVGARRSQLSASLAWSAGLLIVPALCLSIPAGLLLSVGLIGGLSSVIGGVDAVLPAGALAVAIPLALLAPVLGFSIPAAAALKASPLEAIRMER